MHTHLVPKRRNPVLLIVSLLVIAGLACSLGGGGTATDTPAPANTLWPNALLPRWPAQTWASTPIPKSRLP